MAFAGGLIAIVVAVVVVLSHAPEIVSRTSASHPRNIALASVPGGGRACQRDELLPADTTAVGVSLEASSGPRVHLSVLAGKKVLTHGVSAPGWLGKLVTVPVTPLDHAVDQTTVCVSFTGAEERVSFLGVRTGTPSGASSSRGALPGRMTIEYLRRGSSSWWSRVLSVARRMGIGRAWAGTWVAVLVAILMAAAIVVASWLATREPT